MAARSTIKKEVVDILRSVAASSTIVIRESTKIGRGGVGIPKGHLVFLFRAFSRVSTEAGGSHVKRNELAKVASKKVKDLIDLVHKKANQSPS